MAAENPVVFAEIGNPKRVTQLTENTSTTNAYFLTEKAGEPEAKKTAYATVENSVKAKVQSEFLKTLSVTPSDTKTMSEKLEVAEFKKRDDKIGQVEQSMSKKAPSADKYSLRLVDDGGILTNYTSAGAARQAAKTKLGGVLKRGATINYKLNNAEINEVYLASDNGAGVGADGNWSNVRFGIQGENVASFLIQDDSGAVQSFATRQNARNSIPSYLRKAYMQISYIIDGNFTTEQYTSSYIPNWSQDNLWRPIYFNRFVKGKNSHIHIEKINKVLINASTDVPYIIGLAKFYANTTSKTIQFRMCELSTSGAFVRWVNSNSDSVKSYDLSGDFPKVAFQVSGGNVYINVDKSELSRLQNFGFGSDADTTALTSENCLFVANRIDPKSEEKHVDAGLKKYAGVAFPYQNKEELSVSDISIFANLLLDCKIYTNGVPSDEYMSLEVISKQHSSWGDGISLSRKRKSDNSEIEGYVRMSTDSKVDVKTKAELAKISAGGIQFLTFYPFLNYKIELTIDTDVIPTGGIVYVSNYLGKLKTSGFDDSVYNFANKKLEQYEVLSHAAAKNDWEYINCGDSVFRKLSNENIDCGSYTTFRPSRIENGYALVGGENPNISCVTDKIVRFVEDGINCRVFDMNGKYLYYGHDNAIYRVDKKDYSNKAKFTLSGLWTDAKSDASTSVIYDVVEMPDLGLLINLDNQAPNSAVYKVPYREKSYTYTQIDAVKVIHVPNRRSYVNRAWSVDIYGKRVVVCPYGPCGSVYLSDDFGQSFKCIFSMADKGDFPEIDDKLLKLVDTKPNDSGGFGAIGGHPLNTTLTNPVDYKLWIPTPQNMNFHTHGVHFDRYHKNRIRVVTGDLQPRQGIFYTDDDGYNWTLLKTVGEEIKPSSDYATQFVTIMSLPNCVIFGNDGIGDGYWRVFRKGNKVLDTIECAYCHTGVVTTLRVLASGNCKIGNIQLSVMSVESGDDYKNTRGKIVATVDGHNYKEIWEDHYANLTTGQDWEIGWRALITHVDDKILVSAHNGGVIEIII